MCGCKLISSTSTLPVVHGTAKAEVEKKNYPTATVGPSAAD